MNQRFKKIILGTCYPHFLCISETKTGYVCIVSETNRRCRFEFLRLASSVFGCLRYAGLFTGLFAPGAGKKAIF